MIFLWFFGLFWLMSGDFGAALIATMTASPLLYLFWIAEVVRSSGRNR